MIIFSQLWAFSRHHLHLRHRFRHAFASDRMLRYVFQIVSVAANRNGAQVWNDFRMCHHSEILSSSAEGAVLTDWQTHTHPMCMPMLLFTVPVVSFIFIWSLPLFKHRQVLTFDFQHKVWLEIVANDSISCDAPELIVFAWFRRDVQPAACHHHTSRRLHTTVLHHL